MANSAAYRGRDRTNPAGNPLRLLAGVARLGAHAAYDTLARPPARRASDVPCRIEAITAPWLTAALCGETLDAKVESFTLDGETRGTTVRRRIALTYSGNAGNADLPATVFAKSTPSFLHRVTHGLTATMENEALFYRHIRPLLTLEAPRGYFTAYDLNSGRSIQLLEDLVRTKQATFCTPRTPLTRAMAEDMAGVLACFHARFLGANDLPQRFSWLKSYPQWFAGGYDQFGLKRFHDKALIEAESAIPRDVFAQRDDIWPAQLGTLDDHTRAPLTLIHSDVHLGNWYITGDGRMGLCDWQCVSIGLWARDVAYAFSSALAVEDRRAWERDLLRLYLDQVAQKSGVTIDADAAFTAYRRQMIAALLMWTPTLHHSPLMPDMQPRDTAMEMIRRITTAMSDLETLKIAPPI